MSDVLTCAEQLPDAVEQLADVVEQLADVVEQLADVVEQLADVVEQLAVAFASLLSVVVPSIAVAPLDVVSRLLVDVIEQGGRKKRTFECTGTKIFFSTSATLPLLKKKT
jgi:ABC-type transporter Mla subunit MlaD